MMKVKKLIEELANTSSTYERCDSMLSTLTQRGVLLHQITNQSYIHLGPVGLKIWMCCDSVHTVNDILLRLRKEAKVPGKIFSEKLQRRTVNLVLARLLDNEFITISNVMVSANE